MKVEIHKNVYCTLLLSLVLVLILSGVSYGSKRVALVIGNSDYKVSPLKNPKNDATDIAKTLKNLDFEVITKINASKREMVSAADTFYRKLKKAEVGLFYYAGHGMQIRGRNYLLPVAINVTTETDVEFEAVDAGRIIGKMRVADNKLNVVILDACRNNPFKRSFRTAEQGLARMDAPVGTIIAYATGPGNVAADGRGRNGIYTKHLLSAMKQPGLNIQDIFNEAGMKVMRETSNRQVPWTSNTPIPRYYLAGGSYLVEEVPPSMPTRKTGSLRVTSKPSNAALYIDSGYRGTTPVT
ncbi:MAG: hypothetical protein GY702_10695, partial [Desulfobulbaceae bacterium]|nr:hypothetical protein [Desulfobulbaceae bacterium]